MDSRKLTPAHLDAFAAALQRQEKSAATVEKYDSYKKRRYRSRV